MVGTLPVVAFQDVWDGGYLKQREGHSRKIENDEENHDSHHNSGKIYFKGHPCRGSKALSGDLKNFADENDEGDDRDNTGGEEGVEDLVDDTSFDEISLLRFRENLSYVEKLREIEDEGC